MHLQFPACQEILIIASKVSAELKVLRYLCTELYLFVLQAVPHQHVGDGGNTSGQNSVPAAQLDQQLGRAGKEGGHMVTVHNIQTI